MGKLRQFLSSLVVAACLVAVWWAAVLETKSVIFPTPLQVWTATLDLAQHGELWGHIGSSLFRVGVGFLLAAVVGVPLPIDVNGDGLVAR